MGIGDWGLGIGDWKLKLILREYEKVLSSIQISSKLTEKEAICITNILKLNNLLALIDNKRRYLFNLADRCKLIIEQLKINEKKKWCKEFLELYKSMQNYKTPDGSYYQLLEKVKKLNPEVFDELEEKFSQYRGKIEFIDYITKEYPYQGIENDKKNRDFKTYNSDLLLFLQKRYQPENYMPNNEKSERTYCVNHEISSKLGNLLTSYQ